MNKRTSVAVDVLWVFSIAGALISFAAFFAGNEFAQLYSALWACFCVLQAVLLCVYPKGRS